MNLLQSKANPAKMKKSDSLGLIYGDKVQTRMINELYNAGMNMYKIAKTLDIPIKAVRSCFKEQQSPYPTNTIDEALIDKILYDNNIPVATEVIISNEKERFIEYSRLEQTALQTMNKLLSYYASLPIGEDIKRDSFVARLASDFIKVTHSVRQELIQKYAIDKQSDNKETIKVEIV